MGSFALVLSSSVVDSVIDVEDLQAFLAEVDPSWLARYAEIIPTTDGLPIDAGWTWNGSAFEPPPNTMTLDEARQVRFAQIDHRTDELISQGFEYTPGSGVMLSLSLEAQNRLTGVLLLKDSPMIGYPIRWNAINDEFYHDVTDATDVVNMYGTAAGTLKARVQSGTQIKNEIRNALTVDAIMAVVDPR